MSFDVDCGEQLAGHRLVARGLSDDGLGTGFDESGPEVQLFSFEYELVPGVPAGRQDDFFQ